MVMTKLNHSCLDSPLCSDYSGSDLQMLCKTAALRPIREIPFEKLKTLPADRVRPLSYRDVLESLSEIRPTVDEDTIQVFDDWNQRHGSIAR